MAAVRGVDSAIPVVAVSARGEMDAGDFSARGFAGCLRKPFTANELVAVLNTVCGADAAVAPVGCGVAAAGAEQADGVDFSALTAYAGDDTAAARGILESFAEQGAANCALLERALDEGDTAALKAVAHKMTPIFTMLGAVQVAAALRTAESWEGPLDRHVMPGGTHGGRKYPCDYRGSAKKGIFVVNMERILIVDDDITFGLMLKTWLSKKGFGTQTAASAAAARTALAEGGFSLVLSDMRLPDEDGIALLQWMSGQRIEVPVIVMTSYAEIQNAVRCMKLGARRLRRQARHPDELLKKIREALEAPAPVGRCPPGNAGKGAWRLPGLRAGICPTISRGRAMPRGSSTNMCGSSRRRTCRSW